MHTGENVGPNDTESDIDQDGSPIQVCENIWLLNSISCSL